MVCAFLLPSQLLHVSGLRAGGRWSMITFVAVTAVQTIVYCKYIRGIAVERTIAGAIPVQSGY